MDELMTAREVQQALKLKSVESVANYRKQGKIPAHKHPLTGKWIFKRSEIEAVINSIGQ
jgi:hypothetical protein